MENGTLLLENDKITKAFKNMFQTLLNQPRRGVVSEKYDTVEQNIEQLSMEEVLTMLEMLKNGKTPWADDIIPECLKNREEQLIKQLYKLVNTIWDQEEIPTAMKHFHLMPGVHKRQHHEFYNYRVISILVIHEYCNTLYKVLSNVLLKPHIKEIIGDYQSGFIAGKSILDKIYVIKQLIEKSQGFDKDVHLLFVDFKATYNSVNRERLWRVID